MTDTEKLTMLKSMTGETDTDVLSTYLTLAKGVVISKAYPYGMGMRMYPPPTIPPRLRLRPIC